MEPKFGYYKGHIKMNKIKKFVGNEDNFFGAIVKYFNDKRGSSMKLLRCLWIFPAYQSINLPLLKNIFD